MDVLITGATGHLGSYLVDALLEKGHKIKALLQSPDDTYNLRDHEHLEIVYGDITDPETLGGITEGVDAVIHLAAIINYIAPESTIYKVNYEGTKNLIRECAKTGIKKFIFISSTAVYGKKLPKEPIKEDYPLKPNNAYGKSKMLAEQELLKFKEKMNVVILRLSMLYGEGFDKGYFYILRAVEKGSMRLLGDGENNIPILHANDAVQAIILSLENKTKSGTIYNVTNTEPITQKHLLELAAKEFNVQLPKKKMSIQIAKLLASFEIIASYLTMNEPKLLNEYIDKISSDRQFDIYKIEMDLGFIPKISIENGMKEMVKYYLEQEYKEEDNTGLIEKELEGLGG